MIPHTHTPHLKKNRLNIIKISLLILHLEKKNQKKKRKTMSSLHAPKFLQYYSVFIFLLIFFLLLLLFILFTEGADTQCIILLYINVKNPQVLLHNHDITLNTHKTNLNLNTLQRYLAYIS